MPKQQAGNTKVFKKQKQVQKKLKKTTKRKLAKEKKKQEKEALIKKYGQWYCEVCNVYPRGEEQNKMHLNGQKHALKVKKKARKDEEMKIQKVEQQEAEEADPHPIIGCG